MPAPEDQVAAPRRRRPQFGPEPRRCMSRSRGARKPAAIRASCTSAEQSRPATAAAPEIGRAENARRLVDGVAGKRPRWAAQRTRRS